MNVDQIAHDLAIAYVNNRYGVNVTGRFSVNSNTNYDNNTIRDVTGYGEVETERLPDLFEPAMMTVGTGKRHLFVGREKVRREPTNEYAVDPVFRNMISDYRNAYQRLLLLLEA